MVGLVTAAETTTEGGVSTPGAGRPREFDENEVLDALVQLFWTEGFENASLSDIVAAAGLNKSSLYNTFGSKSELFFRALNRYLDERQALLDENAVEGGLDVLLGLFEMMRFEVTEVMPGRGCLAVNASTELGLRDEQAKEVTKKYRAMMRGAMLPPLQYAAEHGEIRADLVDVYADTLLSLGIGLSVAARGGTPVGELNQQVESMFALVESWRIS